MAKTRGERVEAEKSDRGPNAILQVECPLQQRIAAEITAFVYRHGGAIEAHDQYVDPEKQMYFTRIEWNLTGFDLPREGLGPAFEEEVARRMGMHWRLFFSDEVPRIAVFVTREPACLYDIIARCRSGEWRAEVAVVVSNHLHLEADARIFSIPFHHFPITPETKREQELKQIELLRGHGIGLVVLARYMQIVGEDLLHAFENCIINIHHAFLPAFPGAKPYHSAYRRGVKLIGATSHYVTAELDAGPIIEQDVIRVTHRHSVEELIRLGRDLEKIVLARAVRYHIERRIAVSDGRTVIFQ